MRRTGAVRWIEVVGRLMRVRSFSCAAGSDRTGTAATCRAHRRARWRNADDGVHAVVPRRDLVLSRAGRVRGAAIVLGTEA